MESARSIELAATGLAVETTAPALLHAVRGRLHDLTMLIALLAPPRGTSAEPGTAAAKTLQRLQTMGNQIDALERNVRFLTEVMRLPHAAATESADIATMLPGVLTALRDTAIRGQVRLNVDLERLPAHLDCGATIAHVLLVCGAWIVARTPSQGTLALSGHAEEGHVVFEYEAQALQDRREDDDELRYEQGLLSALVASAGGRMSASPRLRLRFPLPRHG